MSFYVTKISGDKELFNPEKLRRSLRKAGASEDVIRDIQNKIEHDPDLRTTRQIYAFAYEYLAQTRPSLAARYSLKHALIEMGPAGFPFEQYIAHLFRKKGYIAVTGQIVVGHCVSHEVDIVCSNHKEQYMVECKFHGRQDLKCDVKVALYVKARFDDVKEAWEKDQAPLFHQGWIVTNTKFTTEAIKFAECRNIQLLGWSYPENEALPDLVAQYGLHPITALTSLNTSQKRTLIENDVVLCQDVERQKDTLRKLGFSHGEIEEIVNESIEVCKVK